MVVLKFGGTSVGKPERMKKIAELVLGTPGKKIVVLSALSGTNNTLVAIGDNLLAGQNAKAEEETTTNEKHYAARLVPGPGRPPGDRQPLFYFHQNVGSWTIR